MSLFSHREVASLRQTRRCRFLVGCLEATTPRIPRGVCLNVLAFAVPRFPEIFVNKEAGAGSEIWRWRFGHGGGDRALLFANPRLIQEFCITREGVVLQDARGLHQWTASAGLRTVVEDADLVIWDVDEEECQILLSRGDYSATTVLICLRQLLPIWIPVTEQGEVLEAHFLKGFVALRVAIDERSNSLAIHRRRWLPQGTLGVEPNASLSVVWGVGAVVFGKETANAVLLTKLEPALKNVGLYYWRPSPGEQSKSPAPLEVGGKAVALSKAEAFDATVEVVVAAMKNGSIALFDGRTFALLRQVFHQCHLSWQSVVCVSPGGRAMLEDGEAVYCFDGARVIVCDVQEYVEKLHLVNFYADGELAVSCHERRYGEEVECRFWDVETRRLVHRCCEKVPWWEVVVVL